VERLQRWVEFGSLCFPSTGETHSPKRAGHVEIGLRPCGDHRTRTWVWRAGSGFFPCQSEQNVTGIASCHSAAGWAAFNRNSCESGAATISVAPFTHC